jgi:TRAF3-interacting protein 1
MSNWKTTSDLFEALIERPKMTEKLLSKPPFKYIFDIITETTKKTGFANGMHIFTKVSTTEKN